MKIYLVGGAVRDQILHLPVAERDWVVVGATVSEMLAQGYRQVGKEFPVFLHPKTNEEYALARQERKVKPGYQGFQFDTSPKVTLEEDLLRRDLTMNAIAMTTTGEIINPFHGKDDIESKVLRHVSAAFSEDPVRILRVGRFLARFYHLGFKVATETTALMRNMVDAGEVDALVAERVWKELERALTEKNPEQFFYVLDSCGALSILFPGILASGPSIAALMAAATVSKESAIRFAAFLYPLKDKKLITALCKRYRVPSRHQSLALLLAANYEESLHAKTLSDEALLMFASRLDVFRRHDRYLDFLCACEAVAASENRTMDRAFLLELAEVVRGVNVQLLLSEGYVGPALAAKLKEARIQLISAWRKS